MNYFGKSPLEMFCPHCDTYGAHPVIRTYAKWYHWGGDSVAMFEKIAGKDISYRQRLKRCKSCGQSFISVEMANRFLKALIEHTQQLESSLRSVSAQRDRILADQTKTHKAIRAASKLLNQRVPKRKPG